MLKNEISKKNSRAFVQNKIISFAQRLGRLSDFGETRVKLFSNFTLHHLLLY